MRPERVGEILLEYGVLHEAAREALDAHREKQFVEPEMRAAFEKALSEFARWVRMKGR